MNTWANHLTEIDVHPVDIHLEPATEARNRLSAAFRIILAIPHIVLVGAPIAAGLSWSSGSDSGFDLAAGGGVLGAVAALSAVIAWFAIIATGRHPDGLWDLAAFYLRWRVRAVAYTALLRDEYPPFGEGGYPANLELRSAPVTRNRLSVAFRFILAIPHILAVWVLGIAWFLTTIVAWFSILLSGRYPAALYGFGAGVLRWGTRVEAYLLLLHDEYPPFSLD